MSLSEQEFRVRSDEALNTARHALLPLADSEGFEVELQNGVLNLVFEEPVETKFVVSPNAPVRQTGCRRCPEVLNSPGRRTWAPSHSMEKRCRRSPDRLTRMFLDGLPEGGHYERSRWVLSGRVWLQPDVGGLMKRTLLALLIAVTAIATFTVSAQQNADRVRALPGDRPAPNTHATRSAVFGRNGMIATSQPLASAAGLKVLQEGGNAIDAAVTAAAVLAVVEPSMTGIGGDLFAIVYDAKTKTLHGLNASGRSAYAATPEEYAKRGLTRMPGSVCCRSRCRASWKAGPSCSRNTRHASDVEDRRAGRRLCEERLRGVGDHQRAMESQPEEAGGRSGDRGHLHAQRPPARAGRDLQQPTPGRDARSHRQGRARRLLQGRHRAGDHRRHEEARRSARRADFADHKADWVEPISTTYRGYDVYEMPPNTQGFVVLEMLNILGGASISRRWDTTRQRRCTP